MSDLRLLLLDIDGLRPDVFRQALESGRVPHLASLLGGPGSERGLHLPALAPAPSITFCSQACLFTGAHPRDHGIPGNQFFDRFGTYNNGVPVHFAFDVGDTLAVDDAVRVFTDGLASTRLMAATLYERLGAVGITSTVAGNMYASGADRWLQPSLANIARFTKGGNLFGMSARDYDQAVLDSLLRDLAQNGMPGVITMYFMGLDHESHKHGPAAQARHLVEVIDPLVGELLAGIQRLSGSPGLPSDLVVAVFSDHGQIEVIPDDRHSLRIGFPVDKEMGHLFDSLGLDVHDYPGEDPDCDAVMALNGGLAHVYLHRQGGRWADPPVFSRDVLPVAQAFWAANFHGTHAAELEDALAGVFVRDVSAHGWQAPYQALAPDGSLVPLESWFAAQPAGLYVDPVNRLGYLSGIYSGDILLLSNYPAGFYFGGPTRGVHGGLHPDDSQAVLSFGMPGAAADQWETSRQAILKQVERRCGKENNRQPGTMDLVTGLSAVLQQ